MINLQEKGFVFLETSVPGYVAMSLWVCDKLEPCRSICKTNLLTSWWPGSREQGDKGTPLLTSAFLLIGSAAYV